MNDISHSDDDFVCPCKVLAADSVNANEYAQCCKPYHKYHKLPETAEQLMRSRYSAYVLHEIDYIIETTLPIQQKLLDQHVLSDWSKQTDWAGLQIIKHLSNVGKRHAQVEFKAWINTDGDKQCHHELSTFIKLPIKKQGQHQNKSIVGNKWYFIDPTLQMNITKKQPCICGSGEKFKHCCGVFLS